MIALFKCFAVEVRPLDWSGWDEEYEELECERREAADCCIYEELRDGLGLVLRDLEILRGESLNNYSLFAMEFIERFMVIEV